MHRRAPSQLKSADRTLRVSLLDGDAEFGKVRASDVGRLLLGTEQILARAAAHVVAGRPGKGVGRRGRLVEDATHLRLLAIETGSVVGVLEVPNPSSDADNELDLHEIESLGQTAVRYAVSTALEGRLVYSDVAAAFVRLATDVGVGSRCRAVGLTVGRNHRKPDVLIDIARRDRLRLVAAPEPIPRTDAITGILVEADFERRTARLRTPFGQAVPVQFDPDLDDAIHELLRRHSELRGEIAYDPSTRAARSIRVRALAKAEQMELGSTGADFWLAPRAFAELQRERGAPAVVDLRALVIETLTDDERDELVQAADAGAL